MRVIYNIFEVIKMYYERIKALRVDRDLSQKLLAEYLTLSRSRYSNYENGIRDIPIEVLSRIADFYQTSVDYLIGRTDEKKPYPLKK